MATTNHQIPLQEAIDMTTLYRTNRPANFPICETFEVEAIEQLIATVGCKFLRIYYGMKENLEVDAILVAADANGEDILPPETVASTADNSILLEDGYRCPQDCPPFSPLNS